MKKSVERLYLLTLYRFDSKLLVVWRRGGMGLQVMEKSFGIRPSDRLEPLQATISEYRGKRMCELMYGTGENSQTLTMEYAQFLKQFSFYIRMNQGSLYSLKNKKGFDLTNKYEAAYIFCDREDTNENRIEIYLEGDTLIFYREIETEFDRYFKKVRKESGQVKEYDFSNEYYEDLSVEQKERIRRAKYNVVTDLEDKNHRGLIRNAQKTTATQMGKEPSHQMLKPDEYYLFEIGKVTEEFPIEIRVRVHHNDPFARLLNLVYMQVNGNKPMIQGSRHTLEYMKKMYERAKALELMRLDHTEEEVSIKS